MVSLSRSNTANEAHLTIPSPELDVRPPLKPSIQSGPIRICVFDLSPSHSNHRCFPLCSETWSFWPPSPRFRKKGLTERNERNNCLRSFWHESSVFHFLQRYETGTCDAKGWNNVQPLPLQTPNNPSWSDQFYRARAEHTLTAFWQRSLRRENCYIGFLRWAIASSSNNRWLWATNHEQWGTNESSVQQNRGGHEIFPATLISKQHIFTNFGFHSPPLLSIWVPGGKKFRRQRRRKKNFVLP